MRIVLIISIITFNFLNGFSFDNPIHFETITQEDGLSSDIVKAIYKDSYGYIWVGTINGLNRYNGEDFTIYSSHWNESKNGLTCNQITSIAEDSNNHLWIGTQNGLFKFDRVSETFEPFYHNPTNPISLSNNSIKKLFLDKAGNFWIATQNGLNKLVDNGNEISFKRYLTGKDQMSIIDITQDEKGMLWLGTWDAGLVRFNPKNEKYLQHLPTPGIESSIPSEKVERVLHLKNGLILLGIANFGLRIFDPETREIINSNKLDQLNKIPAPIYDLKNGSRGEVWIGSGSGLYLYDIFSNSIKYDGNADNFPYIYNPRRDQARTIFIDNNNIVWAGIGKTGLNKYIPGKDKFNKWQTLLKSNPRERDFISSAIYYDYNNILLSTTNGLIKTNSDGDIKERIKFKDNSFIIKIIELDKDKIVAAFSNSIIEYDHTNNRTKYLYYKKNINDIFNRVYDIFMSNDKDKVWLCNEKGLKLYDLKKQSIIDHPFCKYFSKFRVTNILEDINNNYWVSTDENFYYYNTFKDSLINLSSLFPNGDHITTVNVIFQDTEDVFWIGTNNGVIKIIKNDDQIKVANEFSELSNKIIRDISKDEFNNLWFLNPSSLIKYDRSKNALVNFTTKDGLPSSIHKLMQTSDGKTMLLGEKIFHLIPADGIDKNTLSPPIYINNLFINGVSYKYFENLELTNSLQDINKLTLSHQHKTIRFNVVALNYVVPEKNQYAYRLEGFNEDWVNIGTDNDFTLMNLKPGDYTLMIKAANNDNVWSEKILSVDIHVNPAWYLSNLALFGYVLMFMLIFYFIVHYLLYKERLKRIFEVEKNKAIQKYEQEKSSIKREHDLNKLKFDFFLDVSHEFKTPLTIILAHLNKLKNNGETKELDSIYDNAKRLEELIEQLLDIKKLNLKNHGNLLKKEILHAFLKSISASFKEVSEENQLNLNYHVKIEENQSYYFDRDKLYKIVFNLISNAIKYSKPNTNITIEYSLTNYEIMESFVNSKTNDWYTGTNNKVLPYKHAFLNIHIIDEGVGIAVNEIPKIFERFYRVKEDNHNEVLGTGIGLSLTKELVEIMNGVLYIRSEIGKGTEFNLYIPVKIAEDSILEKENETNKQDKVKNLILVVEDNREIQEIIQSVLLDKYEVKKAYNGKEGLEKSQKYIPDLIISDLKMEEMDGFEFIEKIKDDATLKDIPIIVLSVQEKEDSMNKLYALGIDDYITKPFNSDQLLAKVKKIIEYQSKNKDLLLQDVDAATEDMINRDEQFLRKAIAIIEDNIANADFDKNAFAREMGVSESQLYKKLIQLTNQSSNEYVRNIRLKKAAYILQKGTNLQIAEVGYMVGFSDPNYFSRKFKHYFGKTPSQYVQELKYRSSLSS